MKKLGIQAVQNSLRRGIAAAALAALVCVSILASLAPGKNASHTQSLTKPARPSSLETMAAYGKLPIAFEKNLGQTDSRVKFLAHGSDSMLFLTESSAVLRLQSPAAAKEVATRSNFPRRDAPDVSKSASSVVQITLANSNSRPRIDGIDQLPGHSNYIVGKDPSRWRTNVPQFARVKYTGVYPGVDMVFYGHDGLLESDYIVAPGADPNHIQLRIEGARLLTPDSLGNLVMSTASGDVTLERPRAYQQIAGKKQEIAAHFVLRGSRLAGIELGAYDRSQALVIDPILGYSTLLGGTSSEQGNSVVVDSNGDAYICGNTNSTNFPVTSGAYQTSLQSVSGTNAFIAELNPTGTALIFATYFGGTGIDNALGIGIDAGDDVYITGTTTSTDLPIASPSGSVILATFPPGNIGTTGFFVEITNSGTTLTYSSYLGGNGKDTPAGLAVDSSGNAYVVGTTTSTNFPLSSVYNNAYQTFSNSVANGGGAIFLSKINTSSSLPGLAGLLYSTYFGGSDSDGGQAVAADAQGNAYFTGTASSTDFPVTSGAYQMSISPGDDVAYVVRIDTTQSGGASLIYCSYLGGTGTYGGNGFAIAADSNFNAYLGGTTATSNFPVTSNAFLKTQPASGYIMGFVARFNTNDSGNASLTYSTYLGGSDVSGNYVYGIQADSLGDAYVTGSTYTNNYPVTAGVPQGVLNGISNAILTVFNPQGSQLLFSTYWGGTSNDQGNGIVLDTASPPNVYIVGTAKSANFPTSTGAFQTTLKGLSDAFIAKFSPGAAQGVYVSPTSLAFGNQGINSTSAPQTATLNNNASTALSNIAITFTGANAADFAETNTCGATSTTDGSLTAFQSCTISVTFTPSISGAESATLNIADSATTSPQQVTLTGTGTAVSLSPSPLSFGNQPENTTSAAQTVTLTNEGTSALTINSISITGTNAGDFAQTNTCPVSPPTLAASGGNCTISVTFTPTTQSAESATLSVSDSDPSSPQTVPLTGTGTQPTSGVTVSPTSLNFGNQSQGTASQAQTVTIMNAGSSALTFTGISTSGTNAADFTQTNTCPVSPSTLATGGTCTVSVTFTPSTQAAESAALTIADSAPTSPQSVPLTGTGTAPITAFAMSLSPASATITAGQSFTTTATVVSENSFSSAVTFSFVGCPGDSLCSASPNPVTPAANSAVPSTITIQTNLASGAPAGNLRFPSNWHHPMWIWTLFALAFALSGFWAVRRRGVKRLACAFAMVFLIGLASCSGTPTTPKGTYQIGVKGTSGSQTFVAAFTLTVQ